MPPSKYDSLEISRLILQKTKTCNQSQHAHVPKVPLRMISLAPSGSGKAVLHLILNIYRGCFERVCMFSPNLDITWEPVETYQSDVVKSTEEDED